MAKYDVTALGNALVDKEYMVTEDFLKQQNISKGIMTLIDQEPQIELLNSLNLEYGLKKRAGGGCAANSMVTAAHFGASTFYCCKVGDDELGDFYAQDLKMAGVDNKLERQVSQGTTGKCVVMITDDTDRTMCTCLGATSDFGLNEVHESAIRASQYLYIEGHLVYSDKATDAILHAKQIAQDNNVKIALTFSDPAVVQYARENLNKIVENGGLDVIFCNEDEVCHWAQGAGFKQGIAQLLAITPLLVVTKGCEGASIYTNQQETLVPAHKVKAIDTTGAGDTFAGAFMYGLTNGLSLSQSGNLASRSAAECVAQLGARLSQQTQDDIMIELGLVNIVTNKFASVG